MTPELSFAIKTEPQCIINGQMPKARKRGKHTVQVTKCYGPISEGKWQGSPLLFTISPSLALLQTAPAWPLQSQSLVSALQLPELPADLYSTPSCELMTISGSFCPQVHLMQLDLVKSALSLCKCSSTRSQQKVLSTQHQLARMDGRESEKNLCLCESIRASKSMALHQQWNIANLQAILQSGDVSRNTNASANTGFHFCTSTCILYWQKMLRQDICHKARQPGTGTGENLQSSL